MTDYTPTTDDIKSIWRSRYDSEHHWAVGEELRGYEAEFDRWLEQVKAEARAGVPARPLPTRETIARALDQTGAFCGTCSYEPGDFYKNCDDCRRVLDGYADAVLALLKGQDA